MKKTWKIRSIEFENNLVLAPMAGYTDAPFRKICRKFGAGLVVTELITSLGMCFKNEKTMSMLKFYPEEHPVSLQIFGSRPDKMAEAARAGQDCGYDIIDINMGCPAPKIARSGSGGELLSDITKLPELFRAVVNAVDIPVTVKTRVGYRHNVPLASIVAKMAEDEGIAAIAIHGASVKQNSKGSRDWDEIAKTKQTVSIPVCANGGVKKPSDALEILSYTNADAVMIGRACLGKPWFFKDILDIYNGEDPQIVDLRKQSSKIIFDTLFEHIQLEIEYKGENRAIREMRRPIHDYVRGLPKSGNIRDKINKTKNKDELFRILRDYQSTFFQV
ncbi:MAG: tRNA dihydrouridine synthase DusB [Caldisericia bacterium]|nr:tRNA dihydrouridine synthase DusB [Caldisericia bacterium]